MRTSFLETKNNCPVAVVENFYSTEELDSLKKEIYSLHELSKLKIFANYGVDKEQDGEAKQKSSSLFLDDVFKNNRDASNVLRINRKLFLSEDLKKQLVEKNLFFSHVFECNSDHTLLNFYTTDDLYKEHRDLTCFTALTFFSLEAFSGGDLIFPHYGLRIKPTENTVVIFPGFLRHAAEKVQNGIRVSMAQFLNYR